MQAAAPCCVARLTVMAAQGNVRSLCGGSHCWGLCLRAAWFRPASFERHRKRYIAARPSSSTVRQPRSRSCTSMTGLRSWKAATNVRRTLKPASVAVGTTRTVSVTGSWIRSGRWVAMLSLRPPRRLPLLFLVHPARPIRHLPIRPQLAIHLLLPIRQTPPIRRHHRLPQLPRLP
jgi:hypothetical protein